MKILWITNILFPDPAKYLGVTAPVVGGWMLSGANAILEYSDSIQLGVATLYNGDKLLQYEEKGIVYYLLPFKGNRCKYSSKLEPLWKEVCLSFRPDLVHLHGTEFAHGLAFLRACPHVKTVASIQGLVSVYTSYYYAGMPMSQIFRHITLRDILRRDTIFQQKLKFYQRGKIELEIIRRLSHIIGRTEWDKAHALNINPKISYYHCNETLRNEFYKHTWAYDTCTPHSIFISQAGYPIKGVHQLFKALPTILKDFPDTHVYIAGSDITKCNTLQQKIRLSGYGAYLRSLLRHGLSEHVTFLGPLNEKEMCEQYLKCNVFLCPSSIENSPNSLCEALLMGVPSIASYIGGSPDLMKGNEEWLYRFEETPMLAEKIKYLFNIKSSVRVMPGEIQQRTKSEQNAKKLLMIYNSIL